MCAARNIIRGYLALFLFFAVLAWSSGNSPIAQESTPPAIQEVQAFLLDQGLDPGVADGIYGSKTRIALESFQRKSGLRPTGIIDDATVAAMRRVQQIKQAQLAQTRTRLAEASRKARKRATNSSGGIGFWWTIFYLWLAYLFLKWLFKDRSKSIYSSTPQQAAASEFGAFGRGRHDTFLDEYDDEDERVGYHEWSSYQSRRYEERTLTPRQAKTEGDKSWVPYAEPVKIGGIPIPGGMIYVGRSLTTQDGYGDENCLINPRLRVAKFGPDARGEGMGYWPSYSDIPPSSRLAFLQWLAGGRDVPSAYIGFVFLYFYGLERRLLLERATDEADEIIREVKRLRKVYGDNRSFDRYSQAFLDTTNILLGRVDDLELDLDQPYSGWEMPIGVLIYLGRAIQKSPMLDAQTMFLWFMHHPDTRLRTPAKRLKKEFKALFLRKFNKIYPEGMRVRMPKRQLTHYFRPASGSFYLSLDDKLGHIPDITGLRQPINAAQKIAVECMDALDPLSRFLGRHPEKSGSVEALPFYPRDVLTEMEPSFLAALRTRVEELVDADDGMVPVRALSENFLEEIPDKISKKQLTQIASGLGSLGYGMAPDPSFTLAQAKIEDDAFVYRRSEPVVDGAKASIAYQAALLDLALGAYVAHADGHVSEEEAEHLLTHADSAFDLDASEKERLKAQVRWRVHNAPELGLLKRKMKDADANARRSLALFALASAGADGRIDPGEVKALQQIYRSLNLGENDVFTDLHNLAVGGPATEPVTVRQPQTSKDGFKIPQPIDAAEVVSRGFDLDPDRVRAIMQDTARVSSVLSTVFQEEEPEVDTEAPGEVEELSIGHKFAGLDAQHNAFLQELAENEQWPKEGFEQLARGLSLMADGAMEVINDWAFDIFDEAVIEDGDPIIIRQDLLETHLAEANA